MASYHVNITTSVAVIVALFAGTAPLAQTLADAVLWRAPDDGGARRFEVVGGPATLREAPSDTAEVSGEAPEGAILSNFGCKQVGGESWCEVRQFRGGVLAFVTAASVQPAKGPDGVAPTGNDDSPRRARAGDFDVTGEIGCAQERGQAMGLCRAEVARGDGGDATVLATFENGFARRLDFVHGEFVSASTTMSGTGRDVDWAMEGDIHLLRVDDQRFEIADDFLFGK